MLYPDSTKIEPAQWSALIEKYAEISGYPGIYVLGSFAKRVTFYSQQVRALNLVYALHVTEAIKARKKVAVIGGGAAGITAAAALAHRNCEVILLEKLEHVLRLQANCKHRWIHPHIYDWPMSERAGDQAQLPLLNWRAGIAGSVIKEITALWDQMRAKSKIEVHENAQILKVVKRESGTRYRLSWKNSNGKQIDSDIDLLIIAVGFGLEPETPPSVSYWSGDNVDDSFVDRNGKRWLISGLGDGALTDLIRSCTESFDFASFIKQFDATDGSLGIKSDLKEIHSDPSRSDADLSRDFSKLSIPPSFLDKIKPYLRTRGPQVFITGKTSDLYGRSSSVLNRLIVLLLERNKAFTFLPGPSGKMKKSGNRFKVPLGDPPDFDIFDRLIFRHGTHRIVLELTDRILRKGVCKPLQSAWETVSPELDPSRFRHWEPNFFGPEGSADEPLFPRESALGLEAGVQPTSHADSINPAALARDSAFVAAVNRFGARISHFAFYKELRGDGSSTVTYSIQGLTATHRPITGIHIAYESVAGKIGEPALDAMGDRLGMRWERDGEAPGEESMDAIKDRLRAVTGTVFFKQPLRPGDAPISFSLKSIILNGDALTSWEFDQLYAWKDRKHLDREQLRFPLEFVARIVWCPVETLTIQVTLPHESLTPLSFHSFALPHNRSITPGDVLRGSVLHVAPPLDAKSAPSHTAWKKQPDRGPMTDGVRFTNSAALTWELVVDRPAVGSAYSLDWKLPDWMADTGTQEIAHQAEDIRNELLEYRKLRSDSSGVDSPLAKEIRQLLVDLHREITAFQHERGFQETFDLGVMVYNAAKRRLQYVDGIRSSGEPLPILDSFWLPFGLGLSGACLKQGDNPFVFDRKLVNEKVSGPEYYIDIPGSKPHCGMIAIPLVHPRYSPAPDETVEPSRMCVGVMDLSFEQEPKWLVSLMQTKGTRNFTRLREICQNFCNRLCERLNSA